MVALSLLSTLATVAIVTTAAKKPKPSIYPAGHFDPGKSTKLTASTADDFVKSNVDAGKTVLKQAPAWNKVVEDFAGNADVVFGDDSLGMGGWPSIRYFNKATGYGGAAYIQKTKKAMCDELGPKEEYMQQFVEEFATLCDINDTSKGCSEQQTEFIEKWKDKPQDEVKKQLDRLSGMATKEAGSMKPSQLTWLNQRLKIFQQLSAKTEQGSEKTEL